MARITEHRDIPLDDLVIGQGQVRVSSPGKGVDELARSIDAQGLLQPIVVCPARHEGKWEILTGQRRFLAHKLLKREKIAAAVLDSRVDESVAKAISITENLMRRRLSGKELKDGILFLYNNYGSVNDVVEATGLPRRQVQDYVKYPRLIPELKEMVDAGTTEINVALKAQDASEDDDGEPNADDAIRLAKELQPMSGVQRKKVVEDRKDNPDKPIVIQVVATVSQKIHSAIRQVADDDGVNQDEATAGLIEEALSGRGLLG